MIGDDLRWPFPEFMCTSCGKRRNAWKANRLLGLWGEPCFQ